MRKPGKSSPAIIAFNVQGLCSGASPKAEGILYRKALRTIGPVSPGVRVVKGGLVPTASGASPSHRPWTSAWARPLADNLNLTTLLSAYAAGLLLK